MKLHNTKDLCILKIKRDQENIPDAIYECPCMNCELSWIGEMGRKFGTHLEEHKTEVEKVCKKVITRAGRKESLTTTHKSAITDYVVDKKPCHWLGEAKIIGTETYVYKRWVKEAIEIRKWGSLPWTAMRGNIIFLTFIMNCCSIKIHQSENQQATPRPPLKNQRSARLLNVIQVLIKETGVFETFTTLKWVGPGDFVGPILFCIRVAHYSSGEAGWFSASTLFLIN